jgi:hypothetical protein
MEKDQNVEFKTLSSVLLSMRLLLEVFALVPLLHPSNHGWIGSFFALAFFQRFSLATSTSTT